MSVPTATAQPAVQIGWRSGWKTPGGFWYDANAAWRFSATLWIVCNIALIVAQLAFLWYFQAVAPAALEGFTRQLIFFTFTTNLVTWFFAINTWKYARDSKEGMQRFETEFNKQGKELGLTLADLNDIGKAINETGLKAPEVKRIILFMRALLRRMAKGDWSFEAIDKRVKQFDEERKQFTALMERAERVLTRMEAGQILAQPTGIAPVVQPATSVGGVPSG